MKEQYDVIVVGGGTAGVVAAVQAAREGASTLLVERTELLGGTITNAAVAYPQLFHAWKKQVIAGIGWELVERCVKEGNGEFPDFSKQERFRHSREGVHVNRYLYALLCDEAVKESGAELLFDTMIAAAKPENDGWRVTLCTKSGLKETFAKVLIDCTGDANVVTLAGFPVERSETCQPGTYACRVGGVDPEELDKEALAAAFAKEVAAGRFEYRDLSWNSEGFSMNWLSGGSNHIWLDGVTADTSEGKTVVTTEARLRHLRLYRFFKKQPGCEKLDIRDLASECGIRETVRIRGKATVTKEDFLAGKRYDDAVCYTFYPIDIHTHDAAGLTKIYLEEGVVPTIPRGAMLPAGSRNLIVAGRSISSDQAANSAIRVESTAMATGQAAGAMAALGARTGVEVEALPMEALYKVLKKHGAIVPEA